MLLYGLMARPWSPVYIQIDLKDATIKIKDGTTPTANEIEIKIGEGNLTYSESRNIDYTLDRGLLDEVREGDEVPMDISFDFVWDYIRGPSGTTELPSVEDVLKQIGNAAAWVSTDADACRPYSVDLEITHAPTPSTCGDQEVTLLPDFRYESLAHDLRAGTIAATGRSNATQATVTRTPQT